MQQRERKRQKGRKDEGRRDQEGRRNEKEGEAEVKKDVTGWTVVTRNRKQRKMVQIFVRVNGSKATPMDVNLTDDKVEDVIRRIQNDEDVYVTMHRRVMKRGEKLKSYEVADGCTIQVMSRLRGGGKHKDKRSKAEKNQAASTRTPEQKFAEEAKSVKGPATQECDREENEETRKGMIQMMEENEDNRKMIESMSEGSDVDMEQMLQNYRTAGRDV